MKKPDPSLIVFSGLPGVGKTTIARKLSDQLKAVYLRMDSIEVSLQHSQLQIENAQDAGYLIAQSIAADNLAQGHTIVADCVNPVALSRDSWARVAEQAQCRLIEIEIICSDNLEHRQRVEDRLPDIPGQSVPDWSTVQNRYYEPWNRDVLIFDTSICSTQTIVDKLLCVVN